MRANDLPWTAFSNPLGVGVTSPHADVASCSGFSSARTREDEEEIARLIAAAPDLLDATSAFLEWLDREDAGPDYGGLTRDTHPSGEAVWRKWFHDNIDLCGKSQRLARLAVAKASNGDLSRGL